LLRVKTFNTTKRKAELLFFISLWGSIVKLPFLWGALQSWLAHTHNRPERGIMCGCVRLLWRVMVKEKL